MRHDLFGVEVKRYSSSAAGNGNRCETPFSMSESGSETLRSGLWSREVSLRNGVSSCTVDRFFRKGDVVEDGEDD